MIEMDDLCSNVTREADRWLAFSPHFVNKSNFDFREQTVACRLPPSLTSYKS
jgi:hypothetical protein